MTSFDPAGPAGTLDPRVAGTRMPAEPWIAHRQPNPGATLRLFCFPYAGGGAAAFRDWGSHLPGHVEVCPVQLPGRERRLFETPYTDLDPLVAKLADVLAPLLDRPFALFGHSMGALIGFGLARELRRRGAACPLRLFPAAYRAPALPGVGRSIHHLPDAEFLEALRELNGTPREILDNQEMMQLLLPMLRGDIRICGSYVHRPEPPLDIPFGVFGGTDDPHVRREELEAWREETAGACTVRMIAGDHFFLHGAREPLLRALAADLEEASAAAIPPR